VELQEHGDSGAGDVIELAAIGRHGTREIPENLLGSLRLGGVEPANELYVSV
jgi:hypothetical protein